MFPSESISLLGVRHSDVWKFQESGCRRFLGVRRSREKTKKGSPTFLGPEGIFLLFWTRRYF